MRILSPLILTVALASTPFTTSFAQEATDTAQQAERDRSYLTGLIEDNLSGDGRTVRIDGFKGALSSKATFDLMTISDADGAWLTIVDGAIAWNRSALLRGAIEVDELSAAEINLPRLPGSSDESAAPSPEAQPFSLPDLPVSIELGKLDVQKLTLGEPIIGEALTAELSGSMRIADGEGEATLDLQRTDKDAEITLSASFANATRQLGIDLLMREAQNGIIARKTGIPDAPALTLALAGSGPLENFGATVRMTSNGSERLAGKVQILAGDDEGETAFSVDLQGDFAPLMPTEYRAFFGSNTALIAEGSSGGDGQFSLQNLKLESAALKVNGSLDLLPGGLPQRFNLETLIGLGDEPVLLPISGAETYVDGAQITLAYDQARGDGWKLSGSVDGIEREEGSFKTVMLSGSGRIRPDDTAPSIGGTVRLSAQGIALKDPALQAATGETIDLQTIFTWQADAPLRLSRMTLDGAGYSASGQISFDDLAGGLDIQAALTAEHETLERLSLLTGQNLGGALSAEITGTATALSGAFDIDAQITGENLASGIAEIDPILAGTSAIKVSAKRDETGLVLRTATLSTRGIDAEASGTLSSDATDISADLNVKDLSLTQTGVRGAIDLTARVTAQGAKREITLNGVGNGISTQIAEVNKILAGALNLSVVAQEENGRITLQQADLSNAQVSINADGIVADGNQNFNIDARLANAALLAPDFPGPLTVSGSIAGTAQRYQLDLNASGPGGTQAAVTGGLDAALQNLALQITGNTELALANAFIEPRSLQGPLGFDLAINGAPSLAAVSGKIVANNARLVAPALGLILENVDLTTDLANLRAQVNVGAQLSTGGTLTLSGPISLDAPNTADLTIQLNQLMLRDPELYETSVSGQVAINGPLTGGARITGALQLANTELRIPSTGITSIAEIPDIDHVNESAATRETRQKAGLIETAAESAAAAGPAFPIDLTISAPREIFVRGRGLDAELGGSLRVTGSTANVIPIGQFSLIRGRLDILGKRFTLDEGQVALQGALVPWIRFLATTESDDVTTTVQIEGDATSPEITLYSSPELPQEEVLARILFSRDITSLSALQAAQLASAVASLAGKGGAGIISKLRESTGLDDLDVSTDDSGNAELTVGKYISEKVYTDVSVASDGTSEITLNLDVTSNITARGSVGTDGTSGIGVFYEKDY
ncbi:translocation/assembly module TamB domain-containing protein [Albirhodobacter sp. R86504]|uniref:translocation/assembly module TamB domain-containing protein n=1 Tax=Albirhodobacter sp. R86504 TaxID=3093848 RepID=UPI00366D98E1